MPAANPAARICPNCQATVPPGQRHCTVCKLDVSKMDAFAAAKRAAAQKGMRTTQVQSRLPFYLRPLNLALTVVVLLALGAALYWAVPAKTPPWTHFPGTKEDAVAAFLTDISRGDDAGYDKAYALVDPAVRDSQNSDEIGRYRQLYLVVNKYLSSEFGGDWITLLKVTPDPRDTSLLAAGIGVETLHLRVAEQTPPDKLTDVNHHYAITGIDEFNIADAANFQKMAAINGIIGGVAGEGAERNLQTILGAAGGGHGRETPMQTKLRVLPNLRDPRGAVRRTVLQTWPVRKDPVIRNRLENIADDGRYSPDVQSTARQVLQGNVPDEDLIAAGIDPDAGSR